MNVSSINNSTWWYQLNALKKANANDDTTTDGATTATAGNSQNITMNSDGDTFELSGAVPPPPPPGPPPANGAQADSSTESSTNSSSDLIREFLDKVASGTVTDDDLASIQSYLQQMQAGNTGSVSSTGTSGNHHYRGDALKDFLDKVADGSVTDADLSSMQSLLQQMQQNTVSGTSSASNSNSTASQDPLKIFLEKVAAGSVTKDDLTSIQTFLQQLQQGKES